MQPAAARVRCTRCTAARISPGYTRAFGDGPRNFEPWYRSLKVGVTFQDGDRFNSCQVIYSQFGLAIHQNDHQARRRFVEWAQNEIDVVPDFHKQILFSDEAHFWLNGYVNKQNCRIWSEANPQVYVETPLHPEKLTVWCALWAGGILLRKR
ncbi:putative DD41D transposase [Trichonephila clavipes]|nr:putative DD41D transposase [Trichonephila clavipes]